MSILVINSKLREMKNYKQQIERGRLFKEEVLEETLFTKIDFNIISYLLENFDIGVDSPSEKFLISRYKKDVLRAKELNLNVDMAYYVLKTYI